MLSHTYPQFKASMAAAAQNRLAELQEQFTAAVLVPRFRGFLHSWRMRHPRYRYANTMSDTMGNISSSVRTRIGASLHRHLSPKVTNHRKVAAGD